MSTINSLANLPSDPMGKVLSFLNPAELAGCMVTSKNLKAESEKDHLWKELTIKKFGTLALDVKNKYPDRTWKHINKNLTDVFRVIALAIPFLEKLKEQRATEMVNRAPVALGIRRNGNYVPVETVRPTTSGFWAGRKITVYKQR